MKKAIAIVGIGLSAALGLTACGGGATQPPTQKEEVAKKAAKSEAYIPKNSVELDNYNKAQKLYDDPTAIQWCTLFPPSASAPIITVPVAGKLTTSATSYFSPSELRTNGSYGAVLPSRSVDGLYHGDSFYRYGFTPADVYLDISNSMPNFCTTSLLDFQRQNTFVEGVSSNGDASKIDVDARQKSAEKALKAGNIEQASDILAGK